MNIDDTIKKIEQSLGDVVLNLDRKSDRRHNPRILLHKVDHYGPSIHQADFQLF